MPPWIIIAILGTIGITLILARILYRLNGPGAPPQQRRHAAEIDTQLS